MCQRVVNLQRRTNNSAHFFQDVGLYQSPDNQTMKQGSFTICSSKVMSTQQYVHRKLRLIPTDNVCMFCFRLVKVCCSSFVF